MVNTKISYTIIASLVIIAIGLLLPQVVYAGGIGVAPASVDRDMLRPGNSYTQEILISQSQPDADLQVEISVDIPGATDWVRFEPANQFVIAKGVQRFPMNMVIDVPADAEIKPYDGNIRITASPTNADQGSGVSLVKGARIQVQLITTDLDFSDFVVRSVNVQETNVDDPINFTMRIENTGTVPVAPSKVTANILTLAEQEVTTLSTTDLELVAPGEVKVITAAMPHDLEPGEYFADLQVYYQEEVLNSSRLVLNVTGEASGDQVDPDDNGVTGLLESLVANTTVIAVLGFVALIVVVLITWTVIKRRKSEEE